MKCYLLFMKLVNIWLQSNQIKGIFKGRWKIKPSALLVIMQPESLINFQTVPSLENADGNKKIIEK